MTGGSARRLILAAAAGLWACAQPPSAVLIRDVTVIAGDGRVIPRADVLVEGDRVARIDSASAATAPAGTRVIDGSGRFLVPGLFEMHAHTSKTRASALGLYVANGVTTIRDMGGDHEELLRWRNEVRRGERVGPRMLIAGPYLESQRNVDRVRRTPPAEMVEPVERTRVPVSTVSDADRIVDSLAKLELDFLKVRTVASDSVFFALNAAAARNGLRLVGHTMGMSPEQIVAAGHDGIEHFVLPRLDDRTPAERMDAWRALARAGVIVVPTLVTFTEHAFPSREELRAVVADSLGTLDPRRAYLSRFLVLDWAEQAEEATEDRQTFFKRQWPIELQYVREMHAAGVPVLTGSDVAAVNIFPGWSLIDEMVLLQDSVGMTPAAVLERATRMPAEFLGLADSVGTIREGAIADLLLVDADPLVNVANLRRLHTILLRGVVFDRADLDRLLATVRADPDRTVNDWPRTGWAPPAHRTRSEPRLRGHQDRGSSTAAATVAAVARLRPGESP
jgi:imidazolonepropionase-like amidohydrolase